AALPLPTVRALTVGATFVTVIVPEPPPSPPSSSLIFAATAKLPLSTVGHDMVLLLPKLPKPLPQSKAYWKPACVSTGDGSNGLVRLRVNGLPSFTGGDVDRIAVGGAFATVMDCVFVVPGMPKTSVGFSTT